jgi:hypothetical protein
LTTFWMRSRAQQRSERIRVSHLKIKTRTGYTPPFG